MDDVTPGELATRFAGSFDLYQNDGRNTWHSINYIASHDGFCLHDLYSYTDDGQRAWNQGADAILQRQATRNGFAFPMASAGVPMFTGDGRNVPDSEWQREPLQRRCRVKLFGLKKI